MEICKGRTGEISEMCRSDTELFLDWRIPAFLDLEGHQVLHYYESPPFSFSDGCWHLRVYPKYPRGVMLGVCRDDAGSSTKTVNFAAVVNAKGVKRRREEEREFGNDGGCDWWMDLCTRSQLTELRLMVDGAFTIRCEMKIPGAARGVQRALEDFGRLLATGDWSDVTVQVGDVEMQVHSFVLFARCPALTTSLRHESAEGAPDRIVVEDCEPDVFRDFLHYLYTGSLQSLTEDNAFELYWIADRYLVDDLKSECLECVQDAMSVDTFCDAVMLAKIHGEKGLMQRAMAFANQNIQSILRSKEWRTFIRQRPDEATEILIPFATQNFQSMLSSEEWKTLIRQCPNAATAIPIQCAFPPRKRQKSKH